MPRKVFYSFRYSIDHWRVQQIKQIGSVEGSPLLSSNAWEEIKKGGKPAIQKWIDDNMNGTSCTVVLIGSTTAGRDWVKYEITKAWGDKKGLVGVYIHNMKDENSKQSSKGRNPFDDFTVGGKSMSSIVKTYDPPHTISTDVYDHIRNNLSAWVEEAIKIRGSY